jgi:3-hydroxyisobutyrate dehydrogenase
MTQNNTVGFVGLGRMGRSIALNLRRAGTDLIVHDVMPEASDALVAEGARRASSIAEVAREASVIFTSLPGPAQVEEVVLGPDGIVDNMSEGLVLFDLSTSSRELALRIDAAMRAKGGTMFDAPISGGPAGAASGELVVWIGGDEATFERHRAVLERFSAHARYVGPIGSGIVTKLAHNLLGYVILHAQAEALSMAVRADLDPLDFWEALSLGMVGRQSPIMMLTAQVLPAIYDKPAFLQKLALKDVRLAVQMAEELGVEMPLSAVTRAEMEAAVARGQGEEDSRSFVKLQLERAGVSIEVPPERVAEAVSRFKARGN